MPSKSKSDPQSDDSAGASSHGTGAQDSAGRAEAAAHGAATERAENSERALSGADIARLNKHLDRVQKTRPRTNPWDEEGPERDPWTGEPSTDQPFAAFVGKRFEPYSGATRATQKTVQPVRSGSSGEAIALNDSTPSGSMPLIPDKGVNNSKDLSELVKFIKALDAGRQAVADKAAQTAATPKATPESAAAANAAAGRLAAERAAAERIAAERIAAERIAAERQKAAQPPERLPDRPKPAQPTDPKPVPPTSPGTIVPTPYTPASQEKFFRPHRDVHTGSEVTDNIVNNYVNPYLNMVNPAVAGWNTLLMVDEMFRKAAPDIHAGLISLPFIGQEVNALESTPAALEYTAAAISESRMLRSIVQAPAFWFMGAGGVGGGLPRAGASVPKLAQSESSSLNALVSEMTNFRVVQPKPGEEVYIKTFLDQTAQKAGNLAARFTELDPAGAASNLPPGIGFINPFQQGGYVVEYTTVAILRNGAISRNLFRGTGLLEQMRPGRNPDIVLNTPFARIWQAGPWDVTTARQALIKAEKGIEWTFITYTIDWELLFRSALGR